MSTPRSRGYLSQWPSDVGSRLSLPITQMTKSSQSTFCDGPEPCPRTRALCDHVREPAEWTTMEWVPPKPRLQSGGVALRPFRVSDAAAVASACRDPDILRFTFMKDGLTEAEAGEWIDTGNERWPIGHPRFAVVNAYDDHLLGQVGLNFNPRHVSAEAHYWVDASERSRGVASRALSLLVDWGFSKGIQRVFLVIHPENNPSNRLAARLGFTREGVLRSYEPIKSDRPDLVSWSLLPGDPRPWG